MSLRGAPIGKRSSQPDSHSRTIRSGGTAGKYFYAVCGEAKACAFREGTRPNHARLIHYTTAESAISIIRSKRFWMRNTNCMSDYREVQHGYNILQTFFSDQAKHNAFTKALDVCTQGVALEAIKMFDDWWTHIRFSTYISSISEHDDLERICTVGYQCGELLAEAPLVLVSFSIFRQCHK